MFTMLLTAVLVTNQFNQPLAHTAMPDTIFRCKPRAASSDRGWIQREIDRVAAAGGGRVVVPSGEHVSGSIWLRDHVELHLERGAVLKGSGKLEDYDSFLKEVCEIQPEFCDKSFICATNAVDISITGEGVIDGNGYAFCDRNRLKPGGMFYEILGIPRPRIVQFVNCRDVKLKGCTYTQNPCYAMYMRFCENVEIGGITIAEDQRFTNGDGIDIDCCRHVRIGDSKFICGDDCIAVRAVRGSRAEAGEKYICEDVVITNCLLNSVCQAIRVGCVSDDIIRNIRFKNIRMDGHNGIYFGNFLRYVNVRDEGYADIRDVEFDSFTGFLTGNPISILVDPGIRLRGIDDIRFKNFDLCARKGNVFKGSASTVLGRITVENSRFYCICQKLFDAVGVKDFQVHDVWNNGCKEPDGQRETPAGADAPFRRYPISYWDQLFAVDFQLVDPPGKDAFRKGQQARDIRLAKVTIDQVKINDAVSERAHDFKGERSNAGYGFNGGRFRDVVAWRDARGWFSYRLKVTPDARALAVQYNGNDRGARVFDIMVDGCVIKTDEIRPEGVDGLIEREIALPHDVIKGKASVTVTFKAHEGNTAGGLFDLRVIR